MGRRPTKLRRRFRVGHNFGVDDDPDHGGGLGRERSGDVVDGNRLGDLLGDAGEERVNLVDRKGSSVNAGCEKGEPDEAGVHSEEGERGRSGMARLKKSAEKCGTRRRLERGSRPRWEETIPLDRTSFEDIRSAVAGISRGRSSVTSRLSAKRRKFAQVNREVDDDQREPRDERRHRSFSHQERSHACKSPLS